MTKQKGLPPEKKEYLAKALGEEFTNDLVSTLEKTQSLATSIGIESKEAGDEEVDAEIEEFDTGDLEVEQDEEEEAPVVAAKKEAAKPAASKAKAKKPMPKDEEEEKKPAYAKKEAPLPPEQELITRGEVAEALNTVLGPMVQTISTMAGHIEALTKEIAALKEDDAAKIAATKEVTPRASLIDMLSGNVIGKEKARIDGRTTLAKEGPIETEAKTEVQGSSMIPLINQLQAASFELSKSS